MWIATAEQCKKNDLDASEVYGIPPIVLIERAGLAVFENIKQLLPTGGKIVIVAGKGNNGADGLAVSRLAIEYNYHIDVLITALEDELGSDCRTQLMLARAQGVRPIFCDDARYARKMECLGAFDLIIDAILGIGGSGALHGSVQCAISKINRSGVPVISVDVPSGICTDTGADLGDSVWALRTVTFGLPKPCLFQGIGLEHAGYWSVADIGYPSPLLQNPTDARVTSPQWVLDVIPERLRIVHKRDCGHVLVVAGSKTMPGAAVLACQGALRSGAGVVTIASCRTTLETVWRHLPEVIGLELPCDLEGNLAGNAAEVLLETMDRVDSAVFGPGMGQSSQTHKFLEAVWENWNTPSCIDADALNAVANGLKLPDCEAVLTPHPGEMGRLLGCSVAEIQSDRFATVRQAVDILKRTVILKGAHSITGSDEMPLIVNSTGNSGMATAGMGDVLSGIVGTFLAQDLTPYLAAAAGTYLHGLAGDECAQNMGPVGFTASDVALKLPQSRAKLSGTCSTRSRVQSLPPSCSL